MEDSEEEILEREVRKNDVMARRSLVGMTMIGGSTDLYKEYHEFGEYMVEYLKVHELKYIQDMGGSISVILDLYWEQDQKFDDRLTRYGIGDGDSGKERNEMAHIEICRNVLSRSTNGIRNDQHSKKNRERRSVSDEIRESRGERYIGLLEFRRESIAVGHYRRRFEAMATYQTSKNMREPGIRYMVSRSSEVGRDEEMKAETGDTQTIESARDEEIPRMGSIGQYFT